MKFYINQNETETRGEAFTKLCNQKSVTQTIFTKQVCAEGLPLLNRSLAFTIEQNLANIPIIIIAGTRSDYLMRCVYNLIRTPGVLLDNVYIVVDGFYQDVLLIAQVFGVRAVFFPSLRDQLPGQPWDTVIKVHVSRVWSFIFLNTSVDNGIILEEAIIFIITNSNI
ncbi:uncharacterized protein LOC135139841 [Zophobas morio]|uniref:uncharacterized protein LOC135139841 n=1 Tax=Zophobas morio TaxID=2755281 RepID=UPI003082C646